MSGFLALPVFTARTVQKVAALACVFFGLNLAGFSQPNDGRGKAEGLSAISSHSTLRVIAFGSSSTEGVGASTPSASYPAQLQVVLSHMVPKGRDVEVVNRGIGGQDVDDMMSRLQADVINPQPDVVIWQTGSNDPMRNVPLDRFEAKTREGIKAMRRAGAQVILMEPQWCPRLEKSATADAFRQTIRRIGAELNIPVIRRSDMMHKWIDEGRMTREQMLAPDGLHMTDGGYAALARDIAPEVLKASTVQMTTGYRCALKIIGVHPGIADVFMRPIEPFAFICLILRNDMKL